MTPVSASAADIAVLALAPTATYRRRDAVWVPADPSDPLAYPDGRVGTLTIIVQGSRRAGSKVQTDSYGVLEERDFELPDGVRSFVLENETDPDPYGPFRCIVGGMVEVCGCEMGWFDKPRISPTGCKHRAALAALVEEGVI